MKNGMNELFGRGKELMNGGKGYFVDHLFLKWNYVSRNSQMIPKFDDFYGG